jgi:hypothetical protein
MSERWIVTWVVRPGTLVASAVVFASENAARSYAGDGHNAQVHRIVREDPPHEWRVGDEIPGEERDILDRLHSKAVFERSGRVGGGQLERDAMREIQKLREQLKRIEDTGSSVSARDEHRTATRIINDVLQRSELLTWLMQAQVLVPIYTAVGDESWIELKGSSSSMRVPVEWEDLFMRTLRLETAPPAWTRKRISRKGRS